MEVGRTADSFEHRLLLNESYNTTLSLQFIPVLRNLKYSLDLFNGSFYNSSFFDYVQYYPDRIKEDVKTRMAHDLVRDLGEMDRYNLLNYISQFNVPLLDLFTLSYCDIRFPFIFGVAGCD